MPDKVKPLPPGSRKAQNLGGYEELSEDQLQEAFEGEEDPVAKAKEEEEARLAAENDDPADDDEDEQEDAAAEEDDGDDEDEEAEEAEEKEEDEESPLESRIRLLERRLELEALQRTKETAARERAELLASKQAGRAGYLAQQLKKQSPPKAQPKAKADDDGDEDPWAEENAAQDNRQEQVQPPQGLTQDQLEDREELVKMAISDEGSEFAKLHSDDLEEMPQEFLNRLQELMVEEAAPFKKDFQTGSMKMVRKLARTCMSSAYATARIEFADDLAEKATKKATVRKAESTAKSKRRKAKAAISKGGAKATKKPKSAKSYKDMDDDEIEAAFENEFGDDYRRGSDKSRHGGL